MAAEIEMLLDNDRLSISKSQRYNILQSWPIFVLDSMAEIMANKTAVVYVYSSDGDFEFPKINAKIIS